MSLLLRAEYIKLEIVLFSNDDIVRTSANDNVTDLPDFPEDFEGF